MPDINPHTAESPINGGGTQRTDIHCHQCHKTFVAELDMDINGNHVIECPNCQHEHSDARWDARNGVNAAARGKTIWKSSVIAAQTSSAHAFIRNAWLNLKDAKERQ